MSQDPFTQEIIKMGGGYGDRLRRDRAQLLQDIRDGLVTPEQARRDYGVELPAVGE